MKPGNLHLDKLSAGKNDSVSQPLVVPIQVTLIEQLLKEIIETNFYYSESAVQQILKKLELSLREAFDYPKQLRLMVTQGPYYVGTLCVLLASTLLLELILLQPVFTGCLAWGENWHMSWFSHLCLLSPPKWKCIQNKLFWKHIFSIQVLLQDFTIKGTSRIFILGSSWMGLLNNTLSACSERNEDLGWKQVKVLTSFGERRSPLLKLPSRWSKCVTH